MTDPTGPAQDSSGPRKSESAESAGPLPGAHRAEEPPDQPAPEGTQAVAPWSDTWGQTASRSAQILLVSAVFMGTVWLLLRVSLVVIAALVALILASAVYPVVRRLKRKGWSSLLATGAAFIGILGLLSGIITGIVFAVLNEWDSLSTSAVEGWRELESFFLSGPLPFDTAAFDDVIAQATQLATSGAFVDSALTGLTAATEFITGLVLMIVILFFFLKDGPKMWNFALRWFRGETRARLAESGDRTIQILGGYVRGTAIIAAVDAVFIGVALALLGVPLALPLAVIVFVGAFLPIIGATIAGILAALVALVTNGLVVALIVVAVVIVVNQMEGDLLQPVVMGRTLSLHAIVVLLALSVGTIVGGIFGAILSVPLTAVAWSVIQVWTDTYQVGDDPVLGEDPVHPKDRVESKSTMTERWKYQQMRYQERFNRTLYIAKGATLSKKDDDEKKRRRSRRK
ncbi:AI-2 transport protein TqsA [Corynebacterium comes]|uniref:AI-2 transport protein TqsA n=2 Tax=Corynebacterium comes TaxID=2675218 RepID=A0A6B8VJ58_9CORY|nr:AI-2 transport protein TqsA [Corynebacterium comes]